MASYDKVYALVSDIKSSEEYKEYQKVKNDSLANETALSLLKDYRETELKMQQAAFLGQEISEEERAQFERLGELTNIHASVTRFLESEKRLMMTVFDIQKILVEGLNLLEY